MKKIEAIVKRKNFPMIKTNLNAVGTYIIDKRNLDISEHAESAYSDEEEFMLEMDD